MITEQTSITRNRPMTLKPSKPYSHSLNGNRSDPNAWQASGDVPKGYTVGTWGPPASIALIERDGRTWQDAQ
jgi:hypothetical protein